MKFLNLIRKTIGYFDEKDPAVQKFLLTVEHNRRLKADRELTLDEQCHFLETVLIKGDEGLHHDNKAMQGAIAAFSLRVSKAFYLLVSKNNDILFSDLKKYIHILGGKTVKDREILNEAIKATDLYITHCRQSIPETLTVYIALTNARHRISNHTYPV